MSCSTTCNRFIDRGDGGIASRRAVRWRSVAVLCGLIVLADTPAPAWAQLGPANEAGVSIGAVRLLVKDPAVHKKIWMEDFGAVPMTVGTTEMLKLPNGLIVLKKGEPTAGSAGAYLDHIGIPVKTESLPALRAKVAAGGFPSQMAFFTLSDGVKVELLADPAGTDAPSFHHLHFFVPDAKLLRDWYGKTFGATSASRGPDGRISSAKFTSVAGPEGWLSADFLNNADANSINAGRAIDGYGFEVKGLDLFVKKLQADGVKVETPVHAMDGLKTAVVLDPLGNHVDLTEGLGGK